MRKIAQTISTNEAVVLWEVWHAGGNAVLTIPSALARLLEKDGDGKTWVMVKETVPESLQITLVTPRVLENLVMKEEEV